MAKQYQLEKSNTWISLATKPFAGGGEGNLYAITAPKEYRKYVAKLYHPHKLTAKREEKIKYLAAYPPMELSDNAGGHNSVIWVKDALYDHGKFIGFIMPYTEGEKLEILCTPKIPKKLRKEWGRFNFKKSPQAVELRLRLCFNICAAIHQVHKMERYILVDMKPDNIVIQANGLVSIVDTDSVEVVESGKSLFDAPVATPEYTPPEHYRTLDYDPTERETWDRFGLAVILYKLLFGIHPFAASSGAPYEQLTTLHDKIKHGLFVHDPAKKASFKIIPPPHKAFYQLDKNLQDLFFRCFVDGHDDPDLRPSAEEWCAAILLTLDDETAYKRYGHILGGGLYTRKPRFALPSARIALPKYSIAATRLVELSKDSEVPLGQIPTPALGDLKVFKMESLKISEILVLILLGVAFTVLSMPMWGAFGVFFVVGALLYRAQKNLEKNKTYKEAQQVKERLEQTQKKYDEKLNSVRKNKKKFKRSVRWIVPKIEHLTKDIKQKIEELKTYLKEQDVWVKTLEDKALKEYQHLNKKYVDKAIGHRIIARVEDGDYHNLNKIRIAIHNAHKKAVSELTKEQPVKENHPFMTEGKIAVNSLVKNKRTKISDLIGAKLAALYNEQEAKVKLLYQDITADTFIETHLYRLWKGRRKMSVSQKESIKETLEEVGFSSILQVYNINARTGEVAFKDGRTFNVRKFRDSKTILNNLKSWHDQTKHQLSALNKKKAILQKEYRKKVQALEDEKRMELKNLDRFKRGELENLKVETQKIVLGAPFANLQQQYETVTEYVNELETAYEEEEKLVLKDYQVLYESIVKDCEDYGEKVADEVAGLEEALKKYSKKINHPRVQKSYRELEADLRELKQLLPQLEVKSFEAKKYKNINFKNYIRKLTRL